MNSLSFELSGAHLTAMPSGALWWAGESVLCVSDLHLCKSERIMRRGGTMLPPYETRDTLARLDADLQATAARTVICLGDSFDDPAAARAMPEDDLVWILRMQAGRHWIWIEGNHDPGPLGLGGAYMRDLRIGGLCFRHIATAAPESPEISGHYHPKASISARGRRLRRPAFLIDSRRVILPAYGTYTGGLDWRDPVFSELMQADAQALLTGDRIHRVPMPRAHRTGA